MSDVQCVMCGDYLAAARWELGYRTCLFCGEEQAREERTHWCVVPMHKSNYVLVREKEMLLGVNNKGGLVK
jgi:hypothetical protein